MFAYDSSLARHVWCSAWRTADAVCSPPRWLAGWLAGWLAAKLMHGERLAQPQTSLAGPSIFKFAPGASVDLAHAIDFHRRAQRRHLTHCGHRTCDMRHRVCNQALPAARLRRGSKPAAHWHTDAVGCGRNVTACCVAATTTTTFRPCRGLCASRLCCRGRRSRRLLSTARSRWCRACGSVAFPPSFRAVLDRRESLREQSGSRACAGPPLPLLLSVGLARLALACVPRRQSAFDSTGRPRDAYGERCCGFANSTAITCAGWHSDSIKEAVVLKVIPHAVPLAAFHRPNRAAVAGHLRPPLAVGGGCTAAVGGQQAHRRTSPCARRIDSRA